MGIKFKVNVLIHYTDYDVRKFTWIYDELYKTVTNNEGTIIKKEPITSVEEAEAFFRQMFVDLLHSKKRYIARKSAEKGNDVISLENIRHITFSVEKITEPVDLKKIKRIEDHPAYSPGVVHGEIKDVYTKNKDKTDEGGI